MNPHRRGDEASLRSGPHRHILVDDLGEAIVVRFVDLRGDLQVPGQFDETSMELVGLVEAGRPSTLILDFERKEVPPPHTLFLARLIELLKRAKQAGWSLKLCQLPPYLPELFQVARFEPLFPIYRNRDDAMAGIRAGIDLSGSPTTKLSTRPATSGALASSRLGSIVRKSVLLNLAIVLTSFPVLVAAGGPGAVVPTLKVMLGISLILWAATFTIFSCASMPSLFRPPTPSAGKSREAPARTGDGIADPWIDGLA